MKIFKAIKPGFVNGSRVRVGGEFTAPDDFKASWAVPANEYEDPEEKVTLADRSVAEILASVENLSDKEVQALLDAEVSGRGRKSLVAKLQDEIANRVTNPAADPLLN